MKRYRNVIVAAMITSSLVVTPISAAPDVEAIKQEKAQTQQMINSASAQLTEILTEFEMLKGDIRNQETEIKKADEDLKVAQQKEKEQYEEMLVRIKYMYEKGTGSEMESLLGSGSFGEMINQAEYIQNVHKYDRKMLDEYAKTKQEVSDLKESLEEEKVQMETMADVYAQEERSLQSTISTMRAQVANFDVQLAEAQRQAEEEARRIAEESNAIEIEQMQDSEGGQASEEEGSSDTDNSVNTDNKDEVSENNKPAEKPSKPAEDNKPAENNKPAEKPSKPAEDNKPAEKPSKPAENNKPAEKPSKPAENNKPAEKPKPVEKPSKPAEKPSKPSNTAKGQQIANTGLKYVGNPYVYGGNSLTNGIDCSGFTKQIHALCGISGLPRTSSAQRTGGKAVSGGLSNALPGDVICYSGHVAIYIGGGQIVHASNPSPYPKGGIKVSPANYKSILAIRRYW